MVKVAGLAIIANDTGRILMLQRALSDDDPASGKWEFPGGHLEPGETPVQGAMREWREETGAALPPGMLAGDWVSGIYQLFVYRINSESLLEINLDHEDRGILNPDDPDGDNIEIIAWWSVEDLKGNPALREEAKETDWDIFSDPTEVKAEGKIHSFVMDPIFVDPFVGGNEVPEVEPEEGSIWEDLKEIITKQVKKDGIDPESILLGQTKSEVFGDAVSQVYHDVAEFYHWYFNKEDDRAWFLGQQDISVKVPTGLRTAVARVVEENLDGMREVDEIPQGQDVDGLDEILTASLSKYIVNWQDWYYERKKEEELDSYFEQMSFYEEIREDGYTDLTNIVDDSQFDGYSDVPYYSEEP